MGNVNSYDTIYLNELQQRLADLQNQSNQLAAYNQQLQQQAQQLQGAPQLSPLYSSMSPSSSISTTLTPADQDKIREILEAKPGESKALKGLLEDLL